MAPDPRAILRVGLTGNIGAGKTTVGRMLAEYGCLLVDADELARTALAAPAVVAAVVEALGEGVLGASGAIDRGVLAARVFSDADARSRLEAITHPRIRQLEEAAVEAWPRARGIAVTEAALLVETGGAARYDRLVVVVASDDARLERLRERGMPPDDARRRMAAQLDQDAKAAVADYVIDNGGDLDSTRAQVEVLFAGLERDLAGLG